MERQQFPFLEAMITWGISVLSTINPCLRMSRPIAIPPNSATRLITA